MRPYTRIFKLPLGTGNKVRLIDKTGKMEFGVIEGSNEKIRLESLIAYPVTAGGKG